MPVRRAQPHSTVFSFNNSMDPFNFGTVNADGEHSIIYVGTIYVDDQPFEVQLDTGSSDLWIDSQNVTFKSAENTHIFGSIEYVDRSIAEGDIYVATVKFGDFTIEKQAFINSPGTNATTNNDKGLLGLGPPPLSIIFEKLANTSYDGSPVTQNIFNLYSNESNFMTMQLSRSDLGMVDGGVFTIGEIDPNFTAITSSPKLEVLTTRSRWHTIADSVIINGKPHSGQGNNQTNISTAADSGSLGVVLIDSGASLSLLPPYLVDLIYQNVPGAELVPGTQGIYQLPCDTKLNVSFVFAGQEYPIHPIDLIMVLSDDNSSVVCSSALFYSDPDDSQDITLGVNFMKNVYSLFDFGKYSTSTDENPFIQLLSLTDKDKAWAEFDMLNANRINQWQTLKTSKVTTDSSVSETPVVAGNAASDDSTLSTSDSSPESLHITTLLTNSYIIIGLLAGAVVVLFIMAILLFRNQRKVDLGTIKGYKSVNNPVKPFEHKQQFSYETPYDS
ncbi:aspartic peptidase domain-containing protein [Abortiporus biennis]|nr:aspartic peptidase domain-containing protein [Abortiporus biennis]